MKYSVLKKIKLKTSKGEIELRSGQMVALNDDVATRLISEGRISSFGEIAEEVHPETVEPTVTKICAKCGSRAIPYVDSSGKLIIDKCNVHGARLKVTHADIDAWSKKKERNRNSNI